MAVATQSQRHYTVNGVRYVGFNRQLISPVPEWVAMVFVDGDVEHYALDGNDVSALAAMLAADEPGEVRILGVYRLA